MVLRLEGASEAVAYSVELHAPAGAWASRARLDPADGAVTFDGWSPPSPPGWLVEATRTQLRLLWRNHAESGAWPRRITRWRQAPAS